MLGHFKTLKSICFAFAFIRVGVYRVNLSLSPAAALFIVYCDPNVTGHTWYHHTCTFKDVMDYVWWISVLDINCFSPKMSQEACQTTTEQISVALPSLVVVVCLCCTFSLFRFQLLQETFSLHFPSKITRCQTVFFSSGRQSWHSNCFQVTAEPSALIGCSGKRRQYRHLATRMTSSYYYYHYFYCHCCCF